MSHLCSTSVVAGRQISGFLEDDLIAINQTQSDNFNLWEWSFYKWFLIILHGFIPQVAEYLKTAIEAEVLATVAGVNLAHIAH